MSSESIINTHPLPLFFLAVIIIGLIAAQQVIHHYKLSIIPETAVIIVIGAAIGLLTRVTFLDINQHFDILSFDAESFFLYLLPIIVFEGGYCLQKAFFFRNIVTIFSLAIVGTVINIAVTVLLIYVPYHFIPIPGTESVSFFETLTFCTVISAIDPVATLAIFNSLKVDPDLHNLIFGESVLNDAVVVVLFNALNGINADSLRWFTVIEIMWSFCWKTVVSITLGLVVGLLATLYFRVTPMFMSRPWTEVGTLLCFAILSYVTAEIVHCSGVMSVLFTGIICAQYTRRNMSSDGREAAHVTIELLSRVSETAIFLFLGAAISGKAEGSVQHDFNWLFVLLTLISAPIARLFNVVPLLSLANLIRLIRSRSRKKLIPAKHFMMIWYSGLRGAVCFGLVLYMTETSAHSSMFMTTTLILAVVTVLCTGTGTLPMLKLLRIPTNVQIEEAKKDVVATRSKVHGAMHYLDANVLRPLLTRDKSETERRKEYIAREVHGQEELIESGKMTSNPISAASLYPVVGDDTLCDASIVSSPAKSRRESQV
ncbi:Na /H exchanger [Carpediemonas membranifera]|uniref:Sodium/hydrogen exchanger n=1 Tax=Carpediemonas membranifera TaxID=201153 RepID=A0A8J6B893_9EUKA|nr:Na /H exchanger [Carpediemonas membranifera]|eukprot:KAG9395204.1 Na /H exchanger [Carpediemonas membranifera]